MYPITLYYEYGYECLYTERLSTGGYESVFLVNLVAYYLFELANMQFKEIL